jgi:hypothetical protein
MVAAVTELPDYLVRVPIHFDHAIIELIGNQDVG